MCTENTRRAIERAALATLCARGYRATTLEEVGDQVGITRGTVLHHFHSKAELLSAVVDPFLRAFGDLLLHACADNPTTASQRRKFLAELADLFLEHRRTVQLLATDVSAQAQLGLDNRCATQSHRLLTLLAGSDPSDVARVRVAAALGAIVQPVASHRLDLGTSGPRSEIVEAALTVFARPCSAIRPANTGRRPGCSGAGEFLAEAGSQ